MIISDNGSAATVCTIVLLLNVDVTRREYIIVIEELIGRRNFIELMFGEVRDKRN